MPVYRFVCQDCGVSFERRLPVADIHQHQTCPSGHANTRRVFSVPAVVFKGSGFYSTDHRKTQPSTGE